MKLIRRTLWNRLPTVDGRLSGLAGNLTHWEKDGVTFFVRENVSIDTFHITSSERWGMHKGTNLASRHGQTLELCAPKEHWDRLASEVRALDTLQRPVLRNRQFTPAWAERQFTRCKLTSPITTSL